MTINHGHFSLLLLQHALHGAALKTIQKLQLLRNNIHPSYCTVLPKLHWLPGVSRCSSLKPCRRAQDQSSLGTSAHALLAHMGPLPEMLITWWDLGGVPLSDASPPPFLWNSLPPESQGIPYRLAFWKGVKAGLFPQVLGQGGGSAGGLDWHLRGKVSLFFFILAFIDLWIILLESL